MEMNYEKMLDRAYLSIPQKALEHKRFEIPRIESFIEGKKTIVRGFGNLLKDMRRDKKHFLKFLTKETALPITESNGQAIINGKINSFQLNKLVERYFNEYVLCSECKRPDTKIISEGGSKLMKCEACGAMKPVKGL